jgi:hypothetical protein
VRVIQKVLQAKGIPHQVQVLQVKVIQKVLQARVIPQAQALLARDIPQALQSPLLQSPLIVV